MTKTIDEVLERGISQILPDKEKLKNLMQSRKIKLYQGFDPTAESLHIGNFIGLRKLAEFQELGHEVIFLVGDFTAMIGDPTDKTSARQKLTKEQIKTNLKEYKNQASKVLKFDGDNAAKIMFNSEWLSKLTFEDIIELTSEFTVQQMIERDFFQRRLEGKKPIYIHEFLYPLMQGYDSLFMEVDLEIGGNDQLFNMLPGRQLLKNHKDKEKYVLTHKLLEDASGQKMSKSIGNVVNMDDEANQMYGKIMAFSDAMLPLSVELLTDLPLSKLGEEDPMQLKKAVAFSVVSQIYDEEEAKNAQDEFEQTFQKGGVPEDIKEIILEGNRFNVIDLIEQTEEVSSRSQIKRLLDQSAITINNEVVDNPNKEVIVNKDGSIIKIGKHRFVKVIPR